MGKNKAENSSSLHNVIAVGSKIKGDIISEGDIRIDGTVEGNITCKGKVIVGPSSTITGDIECVNLDLMGKIAGNILCSEVTTLKSTSSLVGNINSKGVIMEIGASFTGSCSMYKNIEQEQK